MAPWNSRVWSMAGQSLTARIMSVLGLLMMSGLPAHAFTLSVVDQNGAPVTVGYRYLIEEDTTQHPEPGTTTNNILAFQFHKSWMPPVISGTDADGSLAAWTPDPTKNYLISVVPNFTQDSYGTYFASYNMAATAIRASLTPAGAPISDGNGNKLPTQLSATVIVQSSPLVAAQIVALAFEDNHPINGEPDQDGERGLPGFSVRIDDGGGRYGQIGGQVSVDVFGNPLGTTYMPDPTNPSGYFIDPHTHQPTVQTVGTGTILTDANGYAVIKNLPPGKYGVTLLPPNGSDWIQTSTIEGQHANDAFVKFHEPPYFAEFGPPGPHVFAGFISPTQSVNSAALTGSATVTGRITINHMNRPPHYGFNSGAVPDPSTQCWIGLNATASNEAVYAAPCNPDSTFSIANVPPGAYTVAVWDTALDLIFGTYGFTVDAGGTTCNNGLSCALGDIPQFTWFNRFETSVFFDAAQTGFPGSNPVGIPEIPVNIKFRDGSLDQTFLTTDGNSLIGQPSGQAIFNETFPYFNWQVIEVDSSRLKSTGVTAVVDAGGPIPADQGWTLPSKNKLTPQAQQISTYSGGLKTGYSGPATNPNTGNNLSRTDTGFITTQAFQGFTTGTNTLAFGKTVYGPGENGGISGTVDYATVRAEDNPQYAVSEGLEPGIPHVAVIVYKKPAAGTLLNLADIASFNNTQLYNQITANEAGKRKALPTTQLDVSKGDAKRSKTGGSTNFDYGDAVAYGWTDGWDDNLPTNCQGEIFTATAGVNPNGTPITKATDCFDGLRNFNQIRPGTYDGHYQIMTDKTGAPLPPGDYVVEFFAPRYGNNPSPYKIIKSEDKNVFFGVDFVPANLPPACLGSQALIDPNQYWYGVTGGTTKTPVVTPASYPFDQPGGHLVPPYLSLFPVQDPTAPAPAGWTGTWQPQPPGNKAAPLAGQILPLCMFKEVPLANGQNAKANVEFYTDVPIAAHFVGIILNDLGNEFDVTSPNFGEKEAPAWVPIAIRDSNGQELYRVYSDEWGTYSGLVPSTVTASVPIPTGNSPSVMTLCMNDPGPIPDPKNPGQTMIDPHFLKQFSQFCYTLAYLQGTTTYLDTPVVPVAAYVGKVEPAKGITQLDCELPDGTPKVYSAVNTTNSIMGPVIPTDKGATQTTVLTIVSEGTDPVPNPQWQGQGSGTPKNIQRDFGFGKTKGTVSIGSLTLPSTAVTWNNSVITLKIDPATYTSIQNLPGGVGELVITRGDNKRSTVTSVTVVANVTSAQVHQLAAPVINPISNNTPTPITDAIAAANPGDAVVLAPGIYSEMVIMTKPVQLVGAGAGSVSINPAKTRTDALQTWRNRVQQILAPANGTPTADLLPGQELDFSIPEPGTLDTEEGAGVVILGQAPTNVNPNYFLTKPSRIDGITFFGSDNGGAITANGYVHNLEIANNYVTGNAGAYGGGIRVGVPLLVSANAAGVDDYDSGFNDHAYIHNNEVTTNGGQAAGGGGIQLCTGSDYYKVAYNFICGNFVTGNGGGIAHEGLSNYGLIDHNTIIFNQVFDQSANDNGGGISIASETSLGAGGLRTGTGSVVVSNNIIQGNQAGTGNGGGISLDGVNGQDVAANPTDPTKWYLVTLVNNIITNNQAGYAGGGISMLDVANSGIINNTISNNDSVATADLAFSATVNNGNTSIPQVAGIVSFAHSPGLVAALGGGAGPLYAGFSNPDLRNDIIYDNRSFYFQVNSTTPGDYGLKPNTANLNWDLGVVGAAGSLSPTYSLLTAPTGATNIGGNPIFHAPYFNGSPAVTIQEVEPTSGVVVQPAFDEGGNYIDIKFVPLTQEIFVGGNPSAGVPGVPTAPATFYNYVPKSSAGAPSPVVGAGTNAVIGLYPQAVTDINGTTRVSVDIGAAQATP